MLRLLIVLIVFLVILTSLGESANTSTSLRRITNTPEHILNLNPVISGDGEHVVFESTFDFLGLGGGPAFRTFDASRTEPISQIAISRAVSPAISQDGSAIVFASTEDPLGTNADRNSELFLSVHASGNRTLRQLTNTAPDASTDRLTDGCFDPSITDEGRFVVFSSNRNLNGLNSGNHSEIFLVDTTTNVLRNLTPNANQQSTEPKIAGNASVVAYIQSEALTEARSLIVLDVSSGASRVVVTGNDLKLTRGKAISDQGTRIVYSALVAEDQTQVFLYDSVANTTRQLTELPPRADDVPLNPTISGDGKRITFATRRNVIGGNSDRSVELYLLDLPTEKIAKLTDAPSSASAEVLSSLNDDGSIAAFNFPRVLSGPTSETDFSNNSEIYTLALESRPAFGDLEVLNGASLNHNPQTDHVLAKGSIATARGDALSYATSQAQLASDGSLPRRLNGTKVTVQGTAAQILFVSPTQVNFIIPPQAHNGPAEVTVENLDGFISKTTITIADSAPGVFTLTGDGLGEACVLNAENLLGGPFDPTNGRSRLILFATGVRNTSDVNVIIDGKPSEVESVHPSDDLAGLDEVRVLVPSQLRGAGIVDLSINAGGQTSNLVSLAFSGSSLRDIMINEFLADPPDGIFGDANHDGTRSASDDEFVELVNSTERDLDLSAYVVLTRTANGVDVVRHRFAPQTVIPAGTALVVFGGGNPSSSNPVFAGAQILEASSGSLSLLNSSGRITIIDASGEVITSLSYGGSTGLRADENQSLVRVPDISGDLVQHATVGLMRFSPGARINGGPFLPSPAIAQIQVSPASASVDVGQELQFAASAFDHTGMLLRDVIFNWSSSNESVARIDRHGLLTALRAGAVGITASARGTSSTSSSLLVRELSPSPSPTPTPSPSPTVSPSPSPTPNPSPSVTPSPSPSPTAVSNIVISEFRTRGPNGASDEFVEIYNNSESTIDVSGWKIRTSSNAGSISTRLTISNGTLLPARHHLLFANASAYSGTVHPDQTFATGMANDGGIGLTLPSDVIVDQVGMSSGSAYKEGTNLAPLPSDANQSYERRPGGTAGSTQDSNDNFADFQLRTPSDPQNLNSPPVPNPSPSPSPTPSVSPEPSPSPSPTATPTPTPPPSPALVLSEIYGGGGNAGAAFRNDFIEIFNAGSVAVSLIGWSVQYSSATGTSWTVTNLTSITLAPGQFYLVQEASGGANGAVLPATDVAGMIAMAATAGKVALVNSTAPLTGACPVSPSIVDFVGYGTQANCFRGTGPSTPPGNSTSISRNNQGCSNTGNNNTDFSSGTPSPRNTSSPSNTCSSSLMLELTRMLTRDRTLKM